MSISPALSLSYIAPDIDHLLAATAPRSAAPAAVIAASSADAAPMAERDALAGTRLAFADPLTLGSLLLQSMSATTGSAAVTTTAGGLLRTSVGRSDEGHVFGGNRPSQDQIRQDYFDSYLKRLDFVLNAPPERWLNAAEFNDQLAGLLRTMSFYNELGEGWRADGGAVFFSRQLVLEHFARANREVPAALAPLLQNVEEKIPARALQMSAATDAQAWIPPRIGTALPAVARVQDTKTALPSEPAPTAGLAVGVPSFGAAQLTLQPLWMADKGGSEPPGAPDYLTPLLVDDLVQSGIPREQAQRRVEAYRDQVRSGALTAAEREEMVEMVARGRMKPPSIQGEVTGGIDQGVNADHAGLIEDTLQAVDDMLQVEGLLNPEDPTYRNYRQPTPESAQQDAAATVARYERSFAPRTRPNLLDALRGQQPPPAR